MPYHVVVNPDSVFVVPHFEGGDTVLVRQWRHAWDESSWEVPAGTFNAGEGPLECAQRELAEETGLHAELIHKLADIKYVYVRNWGDHARVFDCQLLPAALSLRQAR